MPPPAPSTPDLRVRTRLAWMAAGLLSVGLFHVLARVPAVAEWLFSARVFHVPSWLLSRASSLLPFPLAEWIVVGFAVTALWWLGHGLGALRRRERHASHLALDAILRLGALTGAVVTVFYLTFGHYFTRPPLADRLGLTLPDSVGVEDLSAVLQTLADSTNAAYLRLHHGQADTTVTVVLPEAQREAMATLDDVWRTAVRTYGLDPALGWRHGPAKTAWLSAGYYERRQPGQYVFFTGEAMLPAGLPVLQWAKSLVHEQAHQRGVAHEGDANFLAYLVGRDAPHDLVRYAVNHFAFSQLWPPLRQLDRRSALRLHRRLLPGVRADMVARSDYFARPADRVGAVASAVNDAYLRSQGVADGVASYGHSAKLILALHLASQRKDPASFK
jgi:hypothetical protein